MDSAQPPSLPHPPLGAYPSAQDWAGKSPARFAILFGPRGILRLYPWLVAPALLAGEHILVADGGNSFNPYDLSKVAAWAGREPTELLRRIHVSRAFTCHQMLALVRKISEFARRRNARLVLLPGVLDTFYDEAIPAREARRVWEATLAHLGRLARGGLLLLAVCPDHAMEGRRPLRASLAGAAERVVVCGEEEGGEMRLRLVKPPGGSGSFGLTFSGTLAAVWDIERR